MGYVDLDAAYKTDSALITHRVRVTVKQAMSLENHVLMLTTMKLDFSNGQLLVGEKSGFIYRSPEVKIETVPLYPMEPIIESDAKTPLLKHPRQEAGTDLYERSVPKEIQSTMSFLKEYTPFLKAESRALPSAVPRAVIYEFLNEEKNNVKAMEVPNPPVEEVGYMTAADIMNWIEDGEKLTEKEGLPLWAPAESINQEKLSTLSPAISNSEKKLLSPPLKEPVQKPSKSVLSFVSLSESNEGERELADQNLQVNEALQSDDTLRSVVSLTTAAESTETGDLPLAKGPFADGPIGSVEEFPAGIGCVTKIVQCGHPNIQDNVKLV